MSAGDDLIPPPAASGWRGRSRRPGCPGTVRVRPDRRAPPTAAGQLVQARSRALLIIQFAIRLATALRWRSTDSSGGGLEGLPDGLLGRVQQLVDLLVVSEMRVRRPARWPGPVQVLTIAIGRLWLMWAFMPASANWTGSIPAVGALFRQRSPGQRHGRGVVLAVSAAAKYRLAKATSRWVMNAGSAKKPWPSRVFTWLVTSRYMRLKHASPSAGGKRRLDRLHPGDRPGHRGHRHARSWHNPPTW